MALKLLETSYARELARILVCQPSGVRQALASLERDGLVSGRAVGRTRVFQVSPTYFAARELGQYLARLAEADPLLRAKVAAVRRRPRRTGKPL